MLPYQRNVLIVAVVVLIVILTTLGVLMSSTSKGNNKSIYPSEISECPDYYTMDLSSSDISTNVVCKVATNIYDMNTTNCQTVDFSASQYKIPGMGPTSGICNKKNWAIGCGVTWDGITNNSNVCYSTT